jgi:hypothetical protein
MRQVETNERAMDKLAVACVVLLDRVPVRVDDMECATAETLWRDINGILECFQQPC